jgi:hypothetical protein
MAEAFTAALIANYDAAFSRMAPPVTEITNYASVQILVASEALTHTPDILLAAALTRIFHMVPVLEMPIQTDSDRHLDFKEGYNAQEQATLGGVGAHSADAVTAFLAKVSGYATELIMCYQVKPLKRANILNYFKSAGVQIQTTDFLIKWLQVASARATRLVSDNNLRNIAVTNKFVKYHIAYASSGSLVAKTADELGNMAAFFMTVADMAAAQAARASPWDMGLAELVSIRSRVVTYAYLEAFEVLPDNWYQGTSAWESASTMAKRDLLMVFKKIKRVSMNNPALLAATNLRDLFMNLPPSVLVEGHPDAAEVFPVLMDDGDH